MALNVGTGTLQINNASHLNLTSLTLGAADTSKFLAGVTGGSQLDPVQLTVAADMDPTGLATIGSLTIKGWTLAKGEPIPAFLTDSTPERQLTLC